MERIVDIATEGHHLSAYRGFLKVEKEGVEIGRVALEDIHAVIVHSHGVTWTGNLVARLAELGAPIVFCGPNHLPVSVALPLEGHQGQGARMQAQIAASKPLSKQIWRKIVAAKIRMQGSLLASLGIEGANAFGFMADRVSSGDKENLEAQAARKYWPLLLGSDFRRDRSLPNENALLNYGYTVMRASCARAIVAAGLHPSLGIQHSNRGNPFALADDLVEPFRPLVDALVVQMSRSGQIVLDPQTKRQFAHLISFDLCVDGEISPVSMAAHRLAISLSRAFEIGRPDLSLFKPPTPMAWTGLTAPSADDDET